MSLFEKATKQKLRFQTSKGNLSVEDLWDLSLESLDIIAVNVDKQLETSGAKSFIGKKSTKNADLSLSLEILKHVIEVKLEEKEAKTNRAAKSAKIAEIKALLAEKQGEAMKGKSSAELMKELEELQGE